MCVDHTHSSSLPQDYAQSPAGEFQRMKNRLKALAKCSGQRSPSGPISSVVRQTFSKLLGSCLVSQAVASECLLVVLWDVSLSSLEFNQMQQEWLQILSHHSCENSSDNKIPFWNPVLQVSLRLCLLCLFLKINL